MNKPFKENAAGANQTAIENSQKSNTLTPFPRQSELPEFTVRLTTYGDAGDVLKSITIKGQMARSLHHIYTSAGGLSRSDALTKYGILSLSHHVHTMRHTYGLNIITERVSISGRDGATWFGRYHFVTAATVEVLSYGEEVR